MSWKCQELRIVTNLGYIRTCYTTLTPFQILFIPVMHLRHLHIKRSCAAAGALSRLGTTDQPWVPDKAHTSKTQQEGAKGRVQPPLFRLLPFPLQCDAVSWTVGWVPLKVIGDFPYLRWIVQEKASEILLKMGFKFSWQILFRILSSKMKLEIWKLSLFCT